MPDSSLLSKLEEVEALATASRMGRLIRRPLRYVEAILFRELLYRWHRRSRAVVTPTFFGTPMHLLLPASTDIYLTGGKSHASELRLARYLIRHLRPGDTMVDVGAHYGYFSLLAARLVGDHGRVYAFEASPVTFDILQQNAVAIPQLTVQHRAVSDVEESLTFYEFPNLYSEYNSLDVEQFRDEQWFAAHPPRAVPVRTVVLNDFLHQNQAQPELIKIDVEGAEDRVIAGLQQHLARYAATVVMEYLGADRSNAAHRRAAAYLATANYTPHCITATGELAPLADIEEYLVSQDLESDNLVFSKLV